MVKDSITGLPLASLDDFPAALKAAILRTNAAGGVEGEEQDQEEATPVVFFAEVVKKLFSQGGKRYEQEVAIVLIKDSVCFFSLDGFIERRIKLSEIAALVLDSCSDEALLSQTNLSAADPTTTLIEETIRVGSLGIIVPGGYDAGFEFVFDPKQRALCAALKARLGTGTPRAGGSGKTSARSTTTGGGVGGWTVGNLLNVATQAEMSMKLFVRAILVLSRKLTLTAAEIQVVSHGDDSTPLHPAAPLHSVLNLQTSDSSGSSSAPVVPPTIETLSKEAQQARMLADSKLEVEEMVSELMVEFSKHKKESWAERNATLLGKVQEIVNERTRVEAMRAQSDALAEELATIVGANDRRAKRLNKEEVDAREALLNRTSGLSKQHDDHVTRVRTLKADIVTVENNIKNLHAYQYQQAEKFIKVSYEADQIFEEAKDSLRAEQIALASCQDLPTLGNLASETGALCDATERVEEQVHELQEVAKEQEESKKSQITLKHDNKFLEQEVLEHKATLRAAKERTEQLTTKVSALFAKRNRVAKDAQWREDNQLPTLRSEIENLNRILGEEMLVHRDLSAKVNLMGAEATVCADHEREILIHNSITKSMAELAVASERVAVEEEDALEDQMAELTASVPATARTHSILGGAFRGSPLSQQSPSLQMVMNGSTPRSALSSGRRQAGGGDPLNSARSAGSGRNISFQQPRGSNQQERRPRVSNNQNPNKQEHQLHQYYDPSTAAPAAAGNQQGSRLDAIPFNNNDLYTTGLDDYGDPSVPGTGRHQHYGGQQDQYSSRSVSKGQVHGEEEEAWIEKALSGSPLSVEWSGVA